VLYGGSGIVGISQATCKEIGAVMDPHVKARMESANGSMDKLLGVIHNLLVTIDDMVFYIQAYVLDNLPFDVLLGCPFQVLSSCKTTDYADRSQMVKLTGPNTSVTRQIYTHD
ncbi:hypothetical protein CALCODRAFT_424203, partial [Calocera cornea HHB12733]